MYQSPLCIIVALFNCCSIDSDSDSGLGLSRTPSWNPSPVRLSILPKSGANNSFSQL